MGEFQEKRKRDQGKKPQGEKGKPANESGNTPKADKRVRVSQGDVPAYSLDDALRVPRAIGDNYAYRPTRPVDVATAMNMQSGSSSFRMLTGAAIAYGLTEGGWNASEIKVLPLSRRILEPTEDGMDLLARREALLRPRVLKEFLEKYDSSKLPRIDIAKNVLVQLGVPREAADRTLKLILDSAEAVGFIRQTNDFKVVDLRGIALTESRTGSGEVITNAEGDDDYDEQAARREQELPEQLGARDEKQAGSSRRTENRRVFITHGKNTLFIDTIKELLLYGEMDPIVAKEHETVSQPVPDKVINDMRNCSAAIIHVDVEQRLVDQDGNAQMIPNPNVLIEIGAALALYDRRFILLVRDGLTLPSNLQGLYEVRYSEDKLDADATIRLLKAIKDIKNHPLPTPTNR